MLIPNGNGQTFYFNINKTILKTFLLFVVTFFIGVLFFLLYAGTIGIKIQLAYYLKSENNKIRDENSKLYSIISKINNMERTQAYLIKINKVTNFKIADNINKKDIDTAVTELPTQNIFNSSNVFESFILPNNGLQIKNSDNKTEIIPINDVYIKSTVNGIVSKIECSKQDGIIIYIDNRNGTLTKYSHFNKYFVSVGDVIKKEQIIAKYETSVNQNYPYIKYEYNSY